MIAGDATAAPVSDADAFGVTPPPTKERTKRRSLGVLAGATVLLALVPVLGLNSYYVTILYYVLFYAAFAQCWNLASGMTDYLSIAHGALLGVSAYAVLIALRAGLPMVAAIAFAVLMGGAGGSLIGALSVKARGLVFAFSTLFILKSAGIIVILWESVTGGVNGIFSTTFPQISTTYLMIVAGAIAVTVTIITVRQSLVGRELLALRDDEDAALALGINASVLKFSVFVISGAFTGYLGATHALFLGSVYPETLFTVEMSLIPLALALVGGSGGVWGPLIAGGAYALVREVFQVSAPGFHLVLLGVAIMVAVQWRRSGLRDWIRRRFSRGAVRP